MIYKFPGNKAENQKIGYQIVISNQLFGPTFDLIKNKNMYEDIAFLNNFFTSSGVEDIIMYMIGLYTYYNNTKKVDTMIVENQVEGQEITYHITKNDIDLFIFSSNDINLMSKDIKDNLNKYEQKLKTKKEQDDEQKRKYKALIKELYPIFEKVINTALKYKKIDDLGWSDINAFWEIIGSDERDYSYRNFRKNEIIKWLVFTYQKTHCRTIFHNICI